MENEPKEANLNPVFYWNFAALELHRTSHSAAGPQTGPTLSSRALGILHLAMHDAYFALKPNTKWKTHLSSPGSADKYSLPELPTSGIDEFQAIAGAAISTLTALYAARSFGTSVSLDTTRRLQTMLDGFVANSSPKRDHRSESYRFGEAVGNKILSLYAVKPGQIGADPGIYEPRDGRYFFRDDPSNPVKTVPIDPDRPELGRKRVKPYHGPFYADTVARIAVQKAHFCADPPKFENANDPADEYTRSVVDVIAKGGAPTLPTTERTADETVAGIFWAYDGSNLIGAPPRLYNQVIRTIAWTKKTDTAEDTAEFLRIFALANVAMTDAGVFAWQEKYFHEYWRPLNGVREHDVASGPGSGPSGRPLNRLALPFWSVLGAPSTNTNGVPFKPPFPAYPSGHATFGAACFQMLRRFYADRDASKFKPDEPDEISFSFVSDELDGVNRDLYQTYDPNLPIADQAGNVRTRIVRHFDSLWHAIYENAMSRIFLGVHWGFDAFASVDGLDNCVTGVRPSKKCEPVKYITRGPRKDQQGMHPIGGVPLGLDIANEIYDAELQPSPDSIQPPTVLATLREPIASQDAVPVKQSDTNIQSF